MIGLMSVPLRADEVTIGSGTSSNHELPCYTAYSYSLTQQIYTAQELGGNEGAIKSVAFYNNGTTQTRNVDIYIVSTEKASFSSKSDWIPVATNDKVFSGQVTLTKNAWTAITFDTPFAYDGTSNIAIMVFDHTGSSYTYNSRVKCLTFTAGNNYQSIYASRDTNVLDPLNPPTSTSGLSAPSYVKYKNQIKLDIEIDIQSCAKPKNFTANPASLTHNSATLTWTEGEEGQSLWEVYYTTSATDEPGDAPTSIYSTSTPNYHLTGLETNTEYYAYVRANCGSGDMSKWAKTTFKTTREAVAVDADTPYTQGFEEENDWEFINGTQSNQWCWGTATHNGDGSKAIYISNDGGTQNTYSNDATVAFATKLFSFSQGYYSFRFNWKANGESKYDYLRVVLVPGDFNYPPGTLPQDLNDNSTPTDWIALDNGAKLNLKSDWQQQVADVSVTGTYTMVFIWKNDTWTNNNPPAAIDNISITRTYPMPTSFSAYQEGPNYAVLAWQENSGASQWNLQYSTDASFTNPVEVSGGTENGFQVNGNFVGYGLLGLNSGTKYYVRVRSVVGDHASDWAETSFQTDCADLTLPYHCDFEGSLDETSFPMPLCWNRNGITIQSKTYPYVYESTSSSNYQYAHGDGANSTSGHCLWFYKTSTTSNETAVLPAIASDYEMSQLQIRFWARLYTNTYAGKTLDIGIMTSPSATGTFQTVGTITVGGDASNAHTNYEEFVIPFTEYTGEGRYIAIRCESTMGSNVVQILVDDITVEEIPFTQNVTLSQGWNWWSPTVETSLEELETALGDKGATIMSQNSGIATYDDDEEEWSGSLTSLVPGQMYLIQVNEDCSFILSGSVLSSVTITIEQGSNWFGYTGMQSVTIEQALNGFAPAENDRIFSFDEGFSTYDGEEWSGTFSHLRPGHGYIYISQDVESKTINF